MTAADSPAAPTSDANGGLAYLIRALKYPNYRLYFGGQSISLVGTWLTRVATLWLVYDVAKNAHMPEGRMLGIVGFAGTIPTLLLAPFAGVTVDRWNKYRLLLITQVLAMLQSLALAGLALAHIINIHHIIWLSVFQGLINTFDMPARQALLVEIVENRDDLANAIALNSSMVNGSRLIGPSVAGILVGAWGVGVCFLIDGLSYIAVIVALLLMKLKPEIPSTRTRSAMAELREGFSYAFGFPPIRAVLLLLAVVSVMGMSYTTLMPIFSDQILHGGPRTLGFLMAASGVGALGGAVYLASRRTVVGLGKVICAAGGIFGVALAIFGYSHFLWLSLLAMLVVGFGMITHFASANTVLQTITDDDKRGRVMSFFSMAFLGMAPFGSLLAGALADRIGPSLTVAITGFFCVAASLYFALRLPALRTHVRPIYIRKGILPEVATGLQSASDGAESPTSH